MAKKAKTKAKPEKDFHIPLAETLKWIANGEALVEKLKAATSTHDWDMLGKLEKRLMQARKEANKLHELWLKELKEKR